MSRLTFAALGLAVAVAVGCGKTEGSKVRAIADKPAVRLVKPSVRTIVRTVGQPGFIEAYEQTSVYAKVAGYIEKWNVDIGDRVKKDQVMATLFVPELVQQHEQTIATVALQKVLVDQAQRLVEVAEGNLKTAMATVTKAEAEVGKFTAEVERWQSEVARQTKLVADQVIDKQVLDESQKQLKSNMASRESAKAAVVAAMADKVAKEAELAKSKVDVDAAKAKVSVAEADERRLKALVGYLSIPAPYDGVVISRTANTGDFVMPAAGDQSGTGMTTMVKGAPIYVVARTDVVRVFVDVPEGDASYVAKGSKGRVRVQAFADAEIEAEVTRTAWALNTKSRTLRAEIDLKNPDSRLLPGMYAYGKVIVERPNVKCVPSKAVAELGNVMTMYVYDQGKAVKTPVQVGVSDGTYLELTRKQVKAATTGGEPTWMEIDGSEEIVLADLSELSDGQEVTIIEDKTRKE